MQRLTIFVFMLLEEFINCNDNYYVLSHYLIQYILPFLFACCIFVQVLIVHNKYVCFYV